MIVDWVEVSRIVFAAAVTTMFGAGLYLFQKSRDSANERKKEERERAEALRKEFFGGRMLPPTTVEEAVRLAKELGSIDTPQKSIPPNRVIGTLTIIALLCGLVLVISRNIIPTNPTELPDSIVTELQAQGIAEQTIATIEAQLQSNHYITEEDLSSAGLNPSQLKEVWQLLSAAGFDSEDNISLVLTSEAIAATSTAENYCYLTPLGLYHNVAIRLTPTTDEDNTIYFLYSGERVRAIAYSGGIASQDKWWLVSFDSGFEETTGWINSSAVEEINKQACLNLEELSLP